MRRPRVAVAAVAVASSRSLQTAAAYVDAKAASGARVWVDPETTGEAFTYQSSRGDKWELVMSDEFNKPGRSFLPGNDHLWTAIEAPDGNDKALEYYAANLATTECEGVVCYLKLQAQNLPRTTSVWVQDATPPGMKNITLNYQSAMLQSWNKFCFQGGMVEVRAKLPGAVGATSKNPDLARGALSQVQSTAFYPTWPGIWLMGNLGRALFRDSTTRMWPFSYNECDDELSKNQRISACDKNPGSGMNANQGRGAPEIDILEGGGLEITASLQIGPGMPAKFRRIPGETPDCVFGLKCRTLGANSVGVPTEAYAARGYKSWYQGLRYAFNPFCAKNETLGGQTLAKIQASLQAGITANKCDISVCPTSLDVNSDLGPLVGSTITTTTNKNWGINTDGSCFAYMSTYQGALLCSPGNPDPECVKQAGNAQAASSGGDKFNYYADAVSANWPIHLAMYTDFLAYQVEWVPGKDGYIRWMLERQPLFEIPAAAINNPPQDDGKKNPTKILPEEPMYIIMNVALSSSWSAQPPNAPRACRDHGSVSDTTKIAQSELICDQFPLDMKIDYVRVYQDMSSSSKMSVGCDPASHPTRQWIKDHIKDYQNAANPMIQVAGKAACITNADCTVTGAASGTCQNGRCQCSSKKWAGPRCTSVWSDDGAGPVGGDSGPDTTPAFGTTKLTEVFGIGFAALVGLVIVVYIGKKIRMWLYYRSQPELDHTVINPENPDTARHSEYAGPAQARWWEQSVNRGGTGAGAAAGAPAGASRGRGAGGLAAIPESPTFGATAASAA